MLYIISALLLGINTACFLFPKIDMWHAQGIWSQALILLLFSYSFFSRPKFIEPKNTPLMLLNLWIGGQTMFICALSQHYNKYDITHFFPYFNFLCILILYKIIVQYLNISDIEKIIKLLRYSVIVTLLVCVLQFFDISQFFSLIHDIKIGDINPFYNNLVTGFIGNGTHLSGFLATMIPLFLWKRTREDWLCLILMAIILLTLTGTTKGDVSASGIITAIVIALYFTWKKSRKYFFVLLSVCILGSIGMFLHDHNIVNNNGRFLLWSYYLGLLKKCAVTGYGLGTVNAIYTHTPSPDTRHLHLEYLHFLFETGIIGLAAIAYFIKDFLSIKTNSDMELLNKSMFIGFLVSCLFNYPAHLWLPATYACFNYAALKAIKER